MSSLLWSTLNLGLLCVLIFRFTKGPLTQFLVERKNYYAQEVEAVSKLLRTAREKLEESERRSRGLAAEVEILKADSERSISRFRDEILKDAKNASQAVVAHARGVVAGMRGDLIDDVKRAMAKDLIRKTRAKLESGLTIEVKSRISRAVLNEVERSS